MSSMFHMLQVFRKKQQKTSKHVNVGVTFQKGKNVFNAACKLKPPKHSDERKNLVAIPVTSATLVRLSNFPPLEDTSTNMQLDVSRKPMVLHSSFSRTKNTQLIGRTEFSWILSRIAEKGRLKKLMNLEKGIEIASCWKEFNPHIRKILSKKYPRGKTNGKIA